VLPIFRLLFKLSLLSIADLSGKDPSVLTFPSRKTKLFRATIEFDRLESQP